MISNERYEVTHTSQRRGSGHSHITGEACFGVVELDDRHPSTRDSIDIVEPRTAQYLGNANSPVPSQRHPRQFATEWIRSRTTPCGSAVPSRAKSVGGRQEKGDRTLASRSTNRASLSFSRLSLELFAPLLSLKFG